MQRKLTQRLIILVASIACLVLLFWLIRQNSFSPERVSKQLKSKELPVVMIVIDTLRSDHLPFYNYDRPTAPFLNSLAQKSVVFEKSYSASSTTAPATASIFTSLYPSEHGVITGYLATSKGRNEDSTIDLNQIPQQVFTLGELFKEAGYQTFGISDNLNIGEQMGFTQGFDRFETYRYKGAEFINQRLATWKDDIKNSEKPFLYIQYMDPHKPYNERMPWYDQYSDGLKSRRAKIVAAYDSEINYVDGFIQQLFDMLDFGDQFILIMTSDHGEEFWDHGKDGHGKSLFREVVQVPFFIYHPKLENRRISQVVHTMDILPTLSSLLETPLRPEWRGRNLLSALHRGELEDGELAFAELMKRDWQEKDNIRSVVRDQWHYIRKFQEPKTPKKEFLFDHSNDPKEEKNLVGEKSNIHQDLGRELDRYDDVVVEGSLAEGAIGVPLDEEMFEQLKTLGYVE